MIETIEKRISRRSFEKAPLTKEEISKINSYIEQLNNKSGLTIQFVEDGSAAFSDLRKSYGLFHNVRSVILMKGNSNDQNLKEKVGYYGEELILNATDLNLGTCWVGGTFDKEKLEIREDEMLVCVIVIGRVKQITLKEKMVRAAMSNNRKPINKRIITDVDPLPQWIIDAIESVRLAPSAKNAQKVIFEYKKGDIYVSVPDDYVLDLVDLGIAKKHFEISAKGKFDLGNGGKYHCHPKE